MPVDNSIPPEGHDNEETKAPPTIEDLKYYLNGTCRTIAEGLDALGLNLDLHEDDLLDGPMAIERCSECEWWCEVSELWEDDEKPAGICSSCFVPGDEQ